MAAGAPPPNDDFADAQELTAGGAPVVGSAEDATREPGDPAGEDPPVWYRWRPGDDGIAVLRFCSTNARLQAYAGSAPDALTPLGTTEVTETGTPCHRKLLRLRATVDREYRFAVGTCFACTGDFTIAIELRPAAANDDFAAAQQLTGAPVSTDGDTLPSSIEPGEDPRWRDSVWYRWTAPATRLYVAQTCSTAPEHVDSGSTIAISTGGGTLASQRVFAMPGRRFPGCPEHHAAVRFQAQAGRTYALTVRTPLESGFPARRRPGPFRLRIAASTIQPAAGDAFAQPIVVDGDDVTLTGSTTDATREAFEPNPSPSSPTIWVDWRAPRTGQAVAESCGSPVFGAELALYRGQAIDSLTRLAAADGERFDEACVPDFSGTVVRWPVTAGDRLRLSYADNPVYSGAYQLRLRVGTPPANDRFATARQVVAVHPDTLTGSTLFARREPGEPVHAEHGEGSIWFSWTARVTGRARLSGCAATGGPVGRVYQGARVDALRRVPSWVLGCTSWFHAEAGQAYRIALEAPNRWNGPVRATLRLNVPSDFNGDGYADLAVGAPGEDDGAAIDAGAVDVRYGGPGGLAADGVLLRLAPGTGDRFGTALASGDLDGDGYADLAVGAPGRRTDTGVPAGAVAIFHGSAVGLESAPDALVRHAAPAAGDEFGAAVATGPFPIWPPSSVDGLAVGAPGDDDPGAADSGSVTVAYGATRQIITQDSPGVPDVSETGDRFGAALASGDLQRTSPLAALAVGAPGEDGGAGAAHVLYPEGATLGVNGSRRLRLGGSLPGAANGGDGFGSSLAIGPLGGAQGGDLVVGAPGDAGPGGLRGGSVLVVETGPNGVVDAGARLLTQASAGETREAGDRFGASVAVGRLGAGLPADLAVGAPGEDLNGHVDAGVVHIVPGETARVAGGTPRLVAEGSAGIPGAPAAHDAFGDSVLASFLNGDGETLLVGAPGETVGAQGPAGAVFALYPSGGPAPQRWTQGAGAVAGAPEAGDGFGRLR